MRVKILVGVIGMIVLVLGGVYAYHSDYFSLLPKGDESHSGTAQYRIKEKSGIPQGELYLEINWVAPDDDYLYEGWLIDDETGYAHSIGAIKTREKGETRTTFKQLMVNPEIYDKLRITREQEDDGDPRPSGIVVMEGKITSMDSQH